MGEFTGQAVYKMWLDDSIKAPIPKVIGDPPATRGPYGPPDGLYSHLEHVGHGFDPSMPAPIFTYKASAKRPPTNCNPGLWGSVWLVSPEVKKVFRQIDPGGVDFHPARLRAMHKEEVVSETDAFLMDIIRFCAALPPGRHGFKCRPNCEFDGRAIGAAKIFRLTHDPYDKMCTQDAYEALKVARVELAFDLMGTIHG